MPGLDCRGQRSNRRRKVPEGLEASLNLLLDETLDAEVVEGQRLYAEPVLVEADSLSAGKIMSSHPGDEGREIVVGAGR